MGTNSKIKLIGILSLLILSFNNCSDSGLKVLSQTQSISAVKLESSALAAKKCNLKTSLLNFQTRNPHCATSPTGSGVFRYVNPTGNDLNDGLSTARPKRSLGKTLQVSKPGDVILMDKGIYREGIETNVGGSVEFPITIQGVPGQTIVKGSIEIKIWEQVHDNVWKILWNPNELSDNYYGYEAPKKGIPQQVFLDGKPLLQIAGIIDSIHPACPDATRDYCRKVNGAGISDLEVTENSFYYDVSTNELWIHLKPGINPNLQVTEVSQNRRILYFYDSSPGSVCIEGLTFQHSNSSAGSRQMYAVKVPKNSLMTNSVVEWMDLAGVAIGSNAEISHSEIRYNGQLGLTTNAVNFKMTSNQIYGNNYRFFNSFWEAGGIKIVGNSNGSVSENHIYNNEGPGVWLDGALGNSQGTVAIEKNYFHGNGRESQIFVEISPNIVVSNNIVVNDNRSGDPNVRAIYVSESENVSILNNTVIKQKASRGIEAATGARGSYNGLQVYGNIVVDSSMTVNTIFEFMTRGGGVFHSDFNLFYKMTGSTRLESEKGAFSVLSNWSVQNNNDFHSYIQDPVFVGINANNLAVQNSSPGKALLPNLFSLEEDFFGSPRKDKNGFSDLGAIQSCEP